MILPNTLIVGMPRCGTSAFTEAITCHPEAWFVDDVTKFRLRDNIRHMEVNFFGHEERYNKGLEWYSRFFEEGAGHKCIGEKTPSYFNVSAISKIKKDLGTDIKIILCVREPVARSYSQWIHFQDKPYGPYWDKYRGLPFEDCINLDMENRMPDGRRGWSPEPHKGENEAQFLYNSDYPLALKSLLAEWRKEQIYVMVLERYKADPQLEYNKLINWLELDQFDLTEEAQRSVNSANYVLYGPEPDEKTDKILREYFKKMKQNFYELIGEEIKEWE